MVGKALCDDPSDFRARGWVEGRPSEAGLVKLCGCAVGPSSPLETIPGDSFLACILQQEAPPLGQWGPSCGGE